jgi:hypothetical protein
LRQEDQPAAGTDLYDDLMNAARRLTDSGRFTADELADLTTMLERMSANLKESTDARP